MWTGARIWVLPIMNEMIDWQITDGKWVEKHNPQAKIALSACVTS